MLSYKPADQFATRMPKTSKKTGRRKWFWPLVSFLALLLVTIIAYHLAYLNKIYPGVYLGDLYLGNLTRQQAEIKANQYLNQQLDNHSEITLFHESETYSLELISLQLEYQVAKSVQNAFEIGRKTNLWQSLIQKASLWHQPTHLPFIFYLDQNKLLVYTTKLASEINQPALEPTVSINPPGTQPRITVYSGQTGLEIKLRQLQTQLDQQLSSLNFEPLEIPFAVTSPSLSENEIKSLSERAENVLGKKITLRFNEIAWELKENDLINFLSFETFGDGYDRFKIDLYITSVAKEIERPPQNAIFQFKEGRVAEFSPDQPGLKLDRSQTNRLLVQALKQSLPEIEINLPVEKLSAEVTTSDANSLGINELLAQGESWFRGSIPNRVHNIKTAAAKLNGLLIPPEKEVSFNQSLGEVTLETGFKEAYVIKQGRTIPEIGGGVCQVSTTFFRAVLQAGLEVTERHAHAYRVGYYEQGSGPGLDATVYSPTADLKFINNTPAYLLIQTVFDAQTSHLTFEIYGTNDGRKVEITRPIITERSDPPPPLYLPDPNLPLGTTKEIEHSIPGAKTVFYQKVTRQGEVILEDTFLSRYQAWQAVILEGTKTP